MNVVFQMVRALEVDHQYDALDIKTTGTDTRSNHDISNAFLVIVNGELSIGMVHGPVQHQTIVTILHKFFKKVIRLGLFINKNEDTPLVIPVSQDFKQSKKFSALFPYFNNLFDVHACLASAAHNYFYRFPQYSLG